jgi:hypothetical protein
MDLERRRVVMHCSAASAAPSPRSTAREETLTHDALLERADFEVPNSVAMPRLCIFSMLFVKALHEYKKINLQAIVNIFNISHVFVRLNLHESNVYSTEAAEV